jgi:hypothetical protein
MEMSGELHAPAALPAGKEPLVPIVYEAVCMRWRRENNPCPCRESKPDSPARGVVTTLTELPRLRAHRNVVFIYIYVNQNIFWGYF